LQQLGFITVGSNAFDPLTGAAKLAFTRDDIALLLPVAAELPYVILGLTAASVIAAISACAGGQLLAIGNALSEDLFYGVIQRSASPSRRLTLSRLTMLATGILAVMFVDTASLDPLRTVLYAFSMLGSTFFAVLVLSIWWQRLSLMGALAGMAGGFFVSFVAISSGGGSFLGIDPLIASAIGAPVSFALAMIVSVIMPNRSSLASERAEELRIPAGETLQVRSSRIGQRGQAAR
jgi:Na+(H+)/acetate symporter ActP